MNVDQRKIMHLDLKDIVITVRNIDIELMNADQRKNLTRHLERKLVHLRKETLKIGITTHV